ncbi:hypothetical protein [Synechococcus sp. CS-1328]|uniref:hypothetical protein n=1 Tax=Synechococcus sp. CS-1328 TaxID=2847976 RepID=UPI00223BFFC0|nr:hypothetical protein [Synechococcus sp. CS-1328]MCT0224733.1 hypothetical protein [Synechococcus sp. CS-1328]
MPEPLVGSLVQAGRLQKWAKAFLTLIADTVETNPVQGYVLIGLALLLVLDRSPWPLLRPQGC